MIEILYLLSTKDNFSKYLSIINKQVLTKELKTIIEDLEVYYSTIAKETIDWLEFFSWFSLVRHSSFKEERLQLYETIFTNLSTYVPTETYEQILKTIITREYATKIADKALSVADGTESDLEDVQELMDEYEKKYASSTSPIIIEELPSFEDLHTTMSSAGDGLDWRLEFFNKSLGPLRKGDFIIFGKRPETGGTTLVASECTFMASQLSDDRPVLYLANEESHLAIVHRIKQAAIGRDMTNIMYDRAKAEEDYVKAVGSAKRIQIKHKPGMSITDIRGWLEAYNPGLIVIDQLWKVLGFHGTAGGEVQRLTMIFAEARRWAQEFAPVLAVHQADGTADGEKWLHYDQLYMSKTGIQGEADAIVMIGATHEPAEAKTRYLNVPKNKLLGGPHTDETMRHGKAEVKIYPEIARYKDK